MATNGCQYLAADEDDGKIGDLAGLDERERLAELVEGAQAAGQRDKGVGVLEEQHLAHEEVAAGDRAIQILVGRLFEGQLDVAADRAPAGLARAEVGGLHESWAAAGHDREPDARDRRPNFPAEGVEGVRGRKARRPEHRDTRADEMEGAESRDEVAQRAHDQPEVFRPGMRSLEQDAVPTGGGGHHLWCRRDCRRIRQLASPPVPGHSQEPGVPLPGRSMGGPTSAIIRWRYRFDHISTASRACDCSASDAA